MEHLILVRFGEIFLKGLNRPFFLNRLVRQIRRVIVPYGGQAILSDSRVMVTGYQDEAACIQRISKVFGVHSLCPAIAMDKGDFEAIAQQAISMMEGSTGTFKVDARRSDKRYPMNSPELARTLGGRILSKNPGLQVDVHHPQHVLNLEIRDRAYLYVQVVPAVGGMPVGTNGRAMLLLSGGIDSPAAGWMIAKRGVSLQAVHFHSHPYTSQRALEKVLTLARIMSESCCPIRVHVVPFTKIQMEIHQKCPSDYTTLIMRRFMMRIAQRLGQAHRCQALITGESIGQVASQTMEALSTTDSVVTMPVFRPLIGFDKEEIIRIAKQIGTFDTSSLPYEDCCTVFTPRHPATHPRMDKILEGEGALDVEGLIQEALEGVERVYCRWDEALPAEAVDIAGKIVI